MSLGSQQHQTVRVKQIDIVHIASGPVHQDFVICLFLMVFGGVGSIFHLESQGFFGGDHGQFLCGSGGVVRIGIGFFHGRKHVDYLFVIFGICDQVLVKILFFSTGRGGQKHYACCK